MSDSSSVGESARRGTKSGEKKKKRKKDAIVVNLANCKYGVVDRSARDIGWEVTKDEEDLEFNVFWCDTSVAPERLVRLRPFQRLNHFPGMHILARKANLARILNRLQSRLSSTASIAPKTWVLPEDWTSFQSEFGAGRKSKRTFILKPSIGSQGRGIYLTRKLDDIDPTVAQVAQRYLSKPLLLDGKKFDLRIYVLVLSCDPLRAYLFEDGLVRLASLEYVAPKLGNLSSSTMHLTNYSLNKHAEGFEAGVTGESGSKRSITWLLGFLAHQGVNVTKVWTSIADLVVKTLLAAQPSLAHVYRSGAGLGAALGRDGESRCCFEILGLDVMLDAGLRPWLLEVNHSPSLTCDAPIDTNVKSALLRESMRLLGLRASDRRKDDARQSAAAKSRLYGAGPSADSDDSSSSAPSSEHRLRLLEKRVASGFWRVIPAPGTEEEDTTPSHTHHPKSKPPTTPIEKKSKLVDREKFDAALREKAEGPWREWHMAAKEYFEDVTSGDAARTGGAGSGRARAIARAADRLEVGASSATSNPESPSTNQPSASAFPGGITSSSSSSQLQRPGTAVYGRTSHSATDPSSSTTTTNSTTASKLERPSTAPAFRGLRLLPGLPLTDEEDERSETKRDSSIQQRRRYPPPPQQNTTRSKLAPKRATSFHQAPTTTKTRRPPLHQPYLRNRATSFRHPPASTRRQRPTHSNHSKPVKIPTTTVTLQLDPPQPFIPPSPRYSSTTTTTKPKKSSSRPPPSAARTAAYVTRLINPQPAQSRHRHRPPPSPLLTAANAGPPSLPPLRKRSERTVYAYIQPSPLA